nr:transposase [Saccharothrix deserti]
MRWALGALLGFRQGFYGCLTARADALFELADAALCTDGPVAGGVVAGTEHRRGHGALYDTVNSGRVDIARLRNLVATQQLPKSADDRIVLAVDVSPWLRPDANTSPGRSFWPLGRKCLWSSTRGAVKRTVTANYGFAPLVGRGAIRPARLRPR